MLADPQCQMLLVKFQEVNMNVHLISYQYIHVTYASPQGTYENSSVPRGRQIKMYFIKQKLSIISTQLL